MITKELLEYIIKESKELNDKQLKNKLMTHGWHKEDINKALELSKSTDFDINVPLPTYYDRNPPADYQTNQQSAKTITDTTQADKNFGMTKNEISSQNTTQNKFKSMWDGFLHILMFISMYVCYVASQNIIFKYVDYFEPTRSSRYNNLANLEVPTAALIVTFPFFAYLFITISKMTIKNPEIKNLTTRKVLIYLNLIINFVTLIFISIFTVAGFLRGDLSTNVLLKLASIALFSGTIFTYYLKQVKDDRQ